MGIATTLETSIDGLLTNFVSTKSAALCGAIAPIALSGITIYLILTGWAIIRGEAHDSLHTFIVKAVKISFVTGLALSAGEYQSVIAGGILAIPGAFLDAIGGAGTLGAMADNFSEPFDRLGNQLWSEATVGLTPSLALCFAAVLVAAAQAITFVIGLGMYLLAKISLALVLAVGPPFILCSLFPATQKFTESWLGQALNFAFLSVLIGASFSMLASFGSQFADHIAANIGSNAIVSDCAALFFACGSLAIVMLNLPQLASALSGGVSIAGIGREIGRALSGGRTIGGQKQDAQGNAGGSMSQGGGTGNPTPNATPDRPRSTSTPRYQERVLDNIRNAA